MFIDESGTPPPPNKKNTKYFVLGAIIIPELKWHSIARDLRLLKQQYCVSGEIKWRFFSPNNNKPNNSLVHLTTHERFSFRDELCSLITKYKSIKLMSVVANTDKYYERASINKPDNVYHLAYKQLMERFQYYLQDLSRTNGIEANGVIVCDHRNSQNDMSLRTLHQKLISGEDGYQSKFTRLIEGLFIAPSHMSVGIQLADIIAGAMFRWYEKDDSKVFDKIKNSFRRSESGDIWGYGIVACDRKLSDAESG
ncbi:MAG: DUF3800 domain-containing protein [Symploca sp. SIO2E9]|nr:DUF3800 domain-containing protein [Symploca sp. SIO2E9]